MTAPRTLPETDAAGNPVKHAHTGHVSNYDESKVGNYTLPDPLVLKSGLPVRDRATWVRQRRGEILLDYQTEIYGKLPADLPKVSYEVTETDLNALGGNAVKTTFVAHLGKSPDAPAVHVTLYVPAQAKKPVPLILHLIFGGPSPAAVAKTPAPPSRVETGPLEDFMGRGYAYAFFRYTEIQPDNARTFESGVIELAAGTTPVKRAQDSWGTISAWAWGTSRILDYFENDSRIDARRVALVGHSRLGKTVLWAGAQDSRFALIFSSCAGELGSALARRDYGETIDDMAGGFPWQFAANLQKYAGHWNDLPVDAHMLLSLCAPRPVFITAGTGDQWADPRGEFLAVVGAGPVYRLLGKRDLGTTDLKIDVPFLEGELGFHYHTSGHKITETDWAAFLTFADRYFQDQEPR